MKVYNSCVCQLVSLVIDDVAKPASQPQMPHIHSVGKSPQKSLILEHCEQSESGDIFGDFQTLWQYLR